MGKLVASLSVCWPLGAAVFIVGAGNMSRAEPSPTIRIRPSPWQRARAPPRQLAKWPLSAAPDCIWLQKWRWPNWAHYRAPSRRFLSRALGPGAACRTQSSRSKSPPFLAAFVCPAPLVFAETTRPPPPSSSAASANSLAKPTWLPRQWRPSIKSPLEWLCLRANLVRPTRLS